VSPADSATESAAATAPRFFVDRSLGRIQFPTLLRAAGVYLVTLAEHYGIPADETARARASPAGRRRWSWQLATRLLGLATPATRAAGVRVRVAGSFDPADPPRDRSAGRARCGSTRSGDLPAWHAVTSRRDDHNVRARVKPRLRQLNAHTSTEHGRGIHPCRPRCSKSRKPATRRSGPGYGPV